MSQVNEEAKPLEITSAASFKKEQLLPLPSGRVVAIRQVSLPSLAQSGRIPNPLLAAAFRIAEGKTDPPGDGEDDEDKKETPEDLLLARKQYYEAQDALVIAVVAKPQLVLKESDEGNDTVWVGRLTETDKKYVLVYAQSSEAMLDSFRNGSTRANAGQDGAEVRQEAD